MEGALTISLGKPFQWFIVLILKISDSFTVGMILKIMSPGRGNIWICRVLSLLTRLWKILCM